MSREDPVNDEGSEFQNARDECEETERPWDGSRSVDSNRMGGSLASSTSHHGETGAHFAVGGARRHLMGCTDDEQSLGASGEQPLYDDERSAAEIPICSEEQIENKCARKSSNDTTKDSRTPRDIKPDGIGDSTDSRASRQSDEHISPGRGNCSGSGSASDFDDRPCERSAPRAHFAIAPTAAEVPIPGAAALISLSTSSSLALGSNGSDLGPPYGLDGRSSPGGAAGDPHTAASAGSGDRWAEPGGCGSDARAHSRSPGLTRGCLPREAGAFDAGPSRQARIPTPPPQRRLGPAVVPRSGIIAADQSRSPAGPVDQ